MGTNIKRHPLVIAGVALVLVGLFSISKHFYDYHQSVLASQNDELEVLDNLGGDFTLTSQFDEQVSLSDFKGKYVLLNFGYASCPDICPNVLTKLALVRKQVAEQKLMDENDIQVLFVTFDPERDTKAMLKAHMEFFDDSFIALTGEIEELKKIILSFGGFFEKQESDSDAYIYAHSDKIYLIDRANVVREFYPSVIKPDVIVRDLKKLH